MDRRQFLVAAGVTLAGCTEFGSGGSGVQDSDGDGVVDSEDYAPNDPDVQEKSDVSGGGSAGGGSGSGGDTSGSGGDDGSDGETATSAAGTPTADPDGWSVRVTYDGRWQGSVSVTTATGDTHQAFDAEGTVTIDVEEHLDVDTADVRSITATGEKESGDDRTLRIEVRKDGGVVAVGSTDEPHGQTVVTHHERSGDGSGSTATGTPPPTDTATLSDTPTATAADTPTADASGWSVRVEHDGDWTVTVSVTTAAGSTHQAFDGDGAETVDVDEQMGVDPEAVRSITATGEKQGDNDRTLRVEIREDGDVAAEGSTDESHGQVVVTHHE